jgi:hypothetical protein
VCSSIHATVLPCRSSSPSSSFFVFFVFLFYFHRFFLYFFLLLLFFFFVVLLLLDVGRLLSKGICMRKKREQSYAWNVSIVQSCQVRGEIALFNSLFTLLRAVLSSTTSYRQLRMSKRTNFRPSSLRVSTAFLAICLRAAALLALRYAGSCASEIMTSRNIVGGGEL